MHKSKKLSERRESNWEAAMIVVNHTCAFPAMTSQNVRCNESSILTSYVFLFFVLQMSSVFCRSSLRTDRPTDIFSVRDSWIECRRTDSECFDVQFAVILLLSDFSSHTHVHNAPANWYKPGSSRMLAAVSSSVFIQVFFFQSTALLKHRIAEED